MKQTYSINGMTCESCSKTVSEKLSAIDGVKNVEVDLEKSKVTIEMENRVPVELLQESLPSKYIISTAKDQIKFTSSDNNEKSDLQQLFPLILILVYLFTAAVLLNYRANSVSGFMLDFMGLFYIVFSFFKFLDLKGFPESFRMYDPLAKRIPVYAKIYPFIELILGLLFLFRFKINIALIATILILGITTIGVTKILLDKKSIQCACLGTALKLPMTKATFIENMIMLVMAVFMLLY